MSRSDRKQLGRIRRGLRRSPDTIGTCLAERLRCLRIERGYDLDEFAAKLGLSRIVLRNYESGKRPIGACVLYEMASVLDTPISRFFDGLSAAGPGRSIPLLDRSESEMLDLLARIRDPELLTRLNSVVRHLALNKK